MLVSLHIHYQWGTWEYYKLLSLKKKEADTIFSSEAFKANLHSIFMLLDNNNNNNNNYNNNNNNNNNDYVK